MDKVDRLGQLLGALRRRVERTREGQRGAASTPAEAAERGAPAGALEGLRERIRQRIGALPADDPSRQARAARIFVESVLVWEFGEAMLADPEFARLVERVDERLATEEELRAQLRDLLLEIESSG